MPMTRQQRRAEERARAKKERRKLGAQPPPWEPRRTPDAAEEEQFQLDVLRLKAGAFAAEHGIPAQTVITLLRDLVEAGTLDVYERAPWAEIEAVAAGSRGLGEPSPDTETKLAERRADMERPIGAAA